MVNKHYDVNYLQNTRRLLKSLKELSYNFFFDVNEGIIVDLGCGGGNDVAELAKLINENVKVLGLDHDPIMLKQARATALGIENTDFMLSEAFPLPFKDETISGLRTERVIQHLNNSRIVIKEIHRVLKKDHPLVVIETDWNSLSFYTELIDIERKVTAYLTDVKVVNGYAAKNLASYLESTNFRNIKFDIHPFVVNTLEDANEYFWVDRIVKEAADKGYITIAEADLFYNALQTADNKKYFACSINLVIVSCIK